MHNIITLIVEVELDQYDLVAKIKFHTKKQEIWLCGMVVKHKQETGQLISIGR